MNAEDIRNNLNGVLAEAREAIDAASDQKELESVRVAFLGKKGKVTEVLKVLGTLSPDERPAAGEAANQCRREIESSLSGRQEEFRALEEQKEAIDLSLPGKKPLRGSEHLLTQIIHEICDFFVGLGYGIAEGPEIETDYNNFTALNTPPGHPARSLHDTFYVDLYDHQESPPFVVKEGEYLLRTHTSPVQVRVMKSQSPPVYIVCPGRVFRCETPDPSHSPIFHQIEGLAVDTDITFADLKGTLERFAQSVFGAGRKVRFRPHFFPFTEPSAEVDVVCFVCEGKGCRTCGNEGWLEVMGAGMVDPNVLKEVGYDPEQVSGFAFGMGVERIAMLRHGITDMRVFYENDLRFLRQF